MTGRSLAILLSLALSGCPHSITFGPDLDRRCHNLPEPPQAFSGYADVLVRMAGSEPLRVGVEEVTQGLWSALEQSNPTPAVLGCDETLPVVVDDPVGVAQLANDLSSASGLRPAYVIAGRRISAVPGADGYRVPTPEEWLSLLASAMQGRPPDGYPCTVGNMLDQALERRSQFYTWLSPPPPSTVWDCDDGWPTLAPVGRFPASPDGLFDVIGNVAEWCWDLANLAVVPHACGTHFLSGTRHAPMAVNDYSPIGWVGGRFVRDPS